MELVSYACTHIGRRDRNEDAHGVYPELGLFVVADGMGGYAGGKLASRLVLTTIRDVIRTERGSVAASRSPAIVLGAAIDRATEAVRTRCHGAYANMGSTVVALAFLGGRAVIGHVGDSRLYRLRAGVLQPLTRDHTLFNAMVDAGITMHPSPRTDAFRSVLSRVIGPEGQDARPVLRVETVLPGDRFLLCSDGLSEVVDDDVLRGELWSRAPSEVCDRLVRRSLASGGEDNVTAVVVAVEEAAVDEIVAPRGAGDGGGRVARPSACSDVEAA